MDSCPEDHFWHQLKLLCFHCKYVCDPPLQTTLVCEELCPDYKPHPATLKEEDQTSTSFEMKPTSDTTTVGTDHNAAVIYILIVGLLMIIVIIIIFIMLNCWRKYVARKRFSETRSTQAYDTRSMNNENAYNENHPMNEGCYFTNFNDKSFTNHLEEQNFLQECSDNYSHPQYIPGDNHSVVAGIHGDQHSDSMLSTNIGSMKPHLKVNARPLGQCEQVQDLTSSSMTGPTQSSTFPKIKGQSSDEAHSTPAMNIHPRMPAHEKYQHQNVANCHNLQSKAENNPIMRDMAPTEVPYSVIDIPPPFMRNISLEHQHSHSSPEPNKCMSNRYGLPLSTRSSPELSLNLLSSPPSQMPSIWNTEPHFPQHHHDIPNSNTEQFLEAVRGQPNDNSSRRSFPPDMESNGKILQHNQETKPKIRLQDQCYTENSHDTSFRLPLSSGISSELSLNLHSSPPSQMPSSWNTEPPFPQHHHDRQNSNIQQFLEAIRGFSGVIHAEFNAETLNVATDRSSADQLNHLKKAIQDIMPDDMAFYKDRINFMNGSYLGLKYAC